MVRRLLVLVVVFVMTVAACGGAAETCEELADETIELVQTMIDDVEDEMGDTTIEEILASEGDLPSLDRFRDRAAEVDERATELACGQDELQTLIQARAGELEATTPIGELIIDGIRSGGL